MKEHDELFQKYLRRPTRRRLATVVHSFHDFVWSCALRITGNREDAADICQDVFLKLLIKPPPPGSVRSARGFLAHRVVRRAYRLRRSSERRRAREQRASAELVGVEGLPADDLRELYAAVDRLPRELREVLEFRYLLGLPIEEIAELISIAGRTVKDRLQRAKQALKRDLTSTGLAGFLLVSDPKPPLTDPPSDLLPDLLQIVSRGAALVPGAGTQAVSAALLTRAAAVLITLLAGAALFCVMAGRFPFGTSADDDESGRDQGLAQLQDQPPVWTLKLLFTGADGQRLAAQEEGIALEGEETWSYGEKTDHIVVALAGSLSSL